WREQTASGPGSAAASIAGPAVRPKHPSSSARPPQLASRAGFRSERSRAISHFPAGVYRLLDKACERLAFERFAEEAQRSGLERARPHRFLGKSGHEDNWYVATLRQKQALQFDAVQARHLQIGDQAGRVVQAW